MSSAEVKNQVNKICQLSRNFRELKFLCNKATDTATEINNILRSTITKSDPTSFVQIDLEEVDRKEKENQEMKELISDYHCGVELLMEAYRKCVMGDGKGDILPQEVEEYDPKLLDTIINQSNQISEMHDLMQRTISIEDDAENAFLEQISFLRKENDVLRELYEISVQFGSSNGGVGSNKLELQEKMCQTEEEVDDQKSEDSGDDEDGDDSDENDDVITVISFNMDGSEDDDEEKEILKGPYKQNTLQENEDKCS